MDEPGNEQSGPNAPADRPEQSMGSAPTPQQSMGSAPGGQGSFGSAPPPGQSMGSAPKTRNVPVLVGGGIGILVLLAAILGFVIR